MRFSEFNIIQEAQELGYYAIGDETVSSLGNGWKINSIPGATSSSASLYSSLGSIPPGSVVAIGVGSNDVKGPSNAIKIANQIDSLISAAKNKGLQPVYLMFQGSADARVESVVDAIGETVRVPTFNVGSGDISSQIKSQVKPAPPTTTAASPKAARTSAGGTPSSVKSVAGSGKAFREPGFKAALEKTAANLGVDPNHLIAIMKQESNLDPQARNPSGATGLIQFMPKTARGLGTSTEAIYNMSATEQLPWVEKYFKSTGIRPGASLGDMYIAVFYPAAMNKGDGHVISKSGNAVYNQNKGLDRNKDGVLTVADVKNSVARYA